LITYKEKDKMKNSNGSAKGILTGVLIGTAVGGAIALLYAPKSGRELRSDIAAKTGEALDSAKTNAGELYNTAIEKGEALLKDVSSLLDSVKESTGTLVNGSRDTITGELQRIKASIQAMLEAYNRIGAENLVHEVTEHHIPRKLKKKLKNIEDIDEKKALAEEIKESLN
jgi:gas vesicle protein